MFNKTVDSITKVFTQAIKDLEALEQAQEKAIDMQEIVIKEATDKLAASVAERRKAFAVRVKLQAIVSN